jgi:hypothetical protein
MGGRGEMIKTPISLQDLRRRIYVKAKADQVSGGSDGVGLGYMRGWGCMPITRYAIPAGKLLQSDRLDSL